MLPSRNNLVLPPCEQQIIFTTKWTRKDMPYNGLYKLHVTELYLHLRIINLCTKKLLDGDYQPNPLRVATQSGQNWEILWSSESLRYPQFSRVAYGCLSDGKTSVNLKGWGHKQHYSGAVTAYIRWSPFFTSFREHWPVEFGASVVQHWDS